MNTLQRLLHLLRWSRHDADLREEIEAHRALRQDAFERDGLAPDDAARASRRALGSVALAVEDVRDVGDSNGRQHAGSILSVVVFVAAGVGARSASVLLVAVAALMLGVASLAALGPARRSLHLPTVDALRFDG